VRGQIHEQVLYAYDQLQEKFVIKGCGVEEVCRGALGGAFVHMSADPSEPSQRGSGVKSMCAPRQVERKKKDKEDEFGFLLRDGGWKKERKRRRGDGGGPGGPLEAVQVKGCRGRICHSRGSCQPHDRSHRATNMGAAVPC
jgi:hypothetical protein